MTLSIIDPLNSEDVDPKMESARQDFASLLEESFKTEYTPGSIVVGEILKVEKDCLMVDVGGKSEGVVPIHEIPDRHNIENLADVYEAGQVKEFYVLSEFDDDTPFLLSVRRVNAWKNWHKLSEMKENNDTVEAKVAGITKGGILVRVMELKGFIPASQLRVAKTLNDLVGDTLPAKILEVDRTKNKLVLSHRQAIFEEKAALRKETLSKLNEGDVVNGEIVKVTDFGVFVDINGIDGLLPLSEITWRRIKHPSEVLALGQQIQVQVLTVDQELQRISLSLKRMETDPWQTVADKFSVGDEFEGQVTKLLNSGVLVELTPGVEAFCAYIPGNKIFFLDERYPFEIVSIQSHDRKITLEYRGTLNAPATAQGY
ncbi:MAG: S1 RNA-binding domain-containing protein [Vampirovibrio sp.]|nr:S1 RNA-binding domain-containing protein [Vampirovibrio sp.]